jgi:hypothetical protein
MCTAEDCHDRAKWIGELGSKADLNGDMSIEAYECDSLDDVEEYICHEILDHCDLDGDG